MVCIAFLMIVIAFGGKCTSVSAKVKLNQKTLYMSKGDKETLKITGTKKKVTWKSSNRKVATVSKKGKVTAKKAGKTTITAKVGGKKLKCKIVVEKKEINRARKLRDYVIRKGKYDKTAGTYSIIMETCDDNGGPITGEITANKKNKKLTFRFTHKPDAPDVFISSGFTMDLISGKKTVRTASFSCSCSYDDMRESRSYKGKISTACNGKGKGFTLTKYTLTEAHYNDETGEEDPIITTIDSGTELEGYENAALKYMNDGFDTWNRLMAGVKTLKKYKISMKTIGFGKWSR